MLELLQQGFGAVFSLNILILMFLGVAVGIVFGAVPGLSRPWRSPCACR